MTDDNKSAEDSIVETGRRLSKGEATRQIQRAREEGFDEGLNKGRQEILDWLENAYINDAGRPDRGTVEAEAILTLARAAADHFRPQTKPAPIRKKRR